MTENHNEILKMVKERFARIVKAPETEKMWNFGNALQKRFPLKKNRFCGSKDCGKNRI